MRIGVDVTHSLQKGLLRRVLRRLPVRCVPEAISEYAGIMAPYKLLQRRLVSPAQPPEQLILPQPKIPPPAESVLSLIITHKCLKMI